MARQGKPLRRCAPTMRQAPQATTSPAVANQRSSWGGPAFFRAFEQSGTSPRERNCFRVLPAKGKVAAPDIAKHKGHMILGVYLKKVIHALTAARASRIFHILDPIGPSAEFIFGRCNADRLIEVS